MITVLVAGAIALAACGGGGSNGGKKLALGTEAVVEYTSPASGSTPAANTTLGVTVLAVRQGSRADLDAAGIEITKGDTNATPFYVDVRYANKGQGPVPRSLSVGMEDASGDSIPTTLDFTFGTPFDLCKHESGGTLDPGQSYEDCTLVLVPSGRKIERVRFVSQGQDAKITFTDWATS
jgi:hypothetical protein